MHISFVCIPYCFVQSINKIIIIKNKICTIAFPIAFIIDIYDDAKLEQWRLTHATQILPKRQAFLDDLCENVTHFESFDMDSIENGTCIMLTSVPAYTLCAHNELTN